MIRQGSQLDADDSARPARDATKASPLIELRNITVSYGTVPALLDVSLRLPAGRLVGIIGPNGSGKSTLIRVIMGFVKPHFGQVFIEGQDVSLAKGRIAYVPQRSEVDWDFPITVREVVLMGRYGHCPWWRDLGRKDHEIATESLRMVRMAEFAQRQIGQLSGGQQQRVFLARALAQQAAILLLDEPFAGVDATTESAIVDVLNRMRAAGRTVLVVHHDLETAAQYFDMLVLLKQRLRAVGTPDEVLRPDLLCDVYEGNLKVFARLLSQPPTEQSTADDNPVHHTQAARR